MIKLRLICGDLFGIAERIRSIDDNYQIFFNGETLRYELHNSACQPTLQLVFPFAQLDARMINYTLSTRVQNLDNLLEEISRHNEKLERQEGDLLRQNTLEAVDTLLTREKDKIEN